MRKNRRTPGLTKRGDVWHIDRVVAGIGRIRESTGCRTLADAETYIAHRVDQLRAAAVYGQRVDIPFASAAAKYLRENQHKRSIDRDRQDLDSLVGALADVPLRCVHMGCPQLKRWLRERRSDWSPGSINRALAVLRRVLNLAARAWRHADGLTWLEVSPLIQLEPDDNPRRPYPLTWAEQRLLFSELPPHLACMALYKVNTGLREMEVTSLRWDWAVDAGELGTVFVIPKAFIKNKDERLVVHNSVAASVIDAARGGHETYVFTYKGRPVSRLYNSGWRSARARAAARYRAELDADCPPGFASIRVHDLKHTFGRRLRAAGVSLEDRQDLLGHANGKITTHYSGVELENLQAAAEKVVEGRSGTAPLILVRRQQN